MTELQELDSRTQLSSLGVFAPWYLRASQLDIYELLLDCKEPFIEASRRFGKTTSIAIFVHELLLKNPGWICRWCAPDQKQARQIVKPIFSQIQKFTKKDERATWRTMDSHYLYPNGSLLYLVGVNQDKGESARGPAANIIVLDEYGFWVEAEYIARSILFPQLQNQQGQWFIKASTPPPSLDHIYYREKQVAIRKSKFIQKLIWDNEALTKLELEKIIEEAGGADSITFRREYLCEEVSDPQKLVIPEWSEENIVPDDYPRPAHFDAYVAIDSGFDDNSFGCFAWYDFNKNEIVVDFEYCDNGKTTKHIIDSCKRIEADIWGEKKARQRVMDGDKQKIFDVVSDHEYEVSLPRKADKIASLHELRSEIGARRFKVKARCTNLIYQLRVGMWANDKHLDFERSNSVGHLDGVAAAMYLQRCVDRTHNPMPQNFGLSRETHWTNQTTPIPTSKAAQTIAQVFSSRARRFT